MQLRGTTIVVNTIASKVPVISGEGATKQLESTDSGSTCYFDRAAGIVYTLPVARPGINFEFVSTKALTSNAAKFICNVAAESSFLIGGVDVVNVVDNTESGFQSAIATGNVAVSMNKTTTGGLVGSRVRVTALSKGTWFVTGLVYGSGNESTPFATS